MKYVIAFLFILSLGSIVIGCFFDINDSEKFIGFGVLGLFFLVFPLFTYYRWKDKDVKDYMLNKENLEKMRNHKKKY